MLFDLNSKSSGFSSVMYPDFLAFIRIPTVPVIFKPACLAWNLPIVSSIIIKSASISVAKIIASASPRSKSRKYDSDFKS
jgi:hypothetical protein